MRRVRDLLEALQRLVTEKMMLPDYKDYAKLVAIAYQARPNSEPGAMASWEALRKHIYTMFKRMQPKVKVEFVDADPYSSAEQMFAEVAKTGVLKISKLFSKTAALGEQDNWLFRAVHDFIVHKGGGHTFNLRGEIGTYNRHAKLAPPAARGALFSEIVGQTSVQSATGAFPDPQKTALLYGFDYEQVGSIDPEDYKKNFQDGKIPAEAQQLLAKFGDKAKPIPR